MMDENDELKLTQAEMAYEDYVISLIAGKTAEQVDGIELTPEQAEKGGHYARNVRMFGRLDPEDFERNYLEEVVRNGPDAGEFEAEAEYRRKYVEDRPDAQPFRILRDQPDEPAGEYDGRDDAFIEEITKTMNHGEYGPCDDGGDDVQLDPADEIPPDETEIYASLI